MSRTLTASDRSALIRLASALPAGSPERKAILAGLEKSAAEKMLYTVSINVPRDSVHAAREVQKALDSALDAAIKKIKGMEGHKGVTSKIRS